MRGQHVAPSLSGAKERLDMLLHQEGGAGIGKAPVRKEASFRGFPRDNGHIHVAIVAQETGQERIDGIGRPFYELCEMDLGKEQGAGDPVRGVPLPRYRDDLRDLPIGRQEHGAFTHIEERADHLAIHGFEKHCEIADAARETYAASVGYAVMRQGSVMESPKNLAPFAVRLKGRAQLTPDDCAAIINLAHIIRRYAAGKSIIAQGEEPKACLILLGGMAIRYRPLSDGSRQIIGIHIENELIDLQFSSLQKALHVVRAVTPCIVAAVLQADFLAFLRERPAVAEALWRETLTSTTVAREWIVNLGRRDAPARIAHFLCEMATRQGVDCSCGRCAFQLPLTQEQMGDIVGLSAVHVNRTLQLLRREGLISARRQDVMIDDWPALQDLADFDPAYLRQAH